MKKAQMVGLLSLTVAAIWANTAVAAAEPYGSVGEAYLAGSKACAGQFEKMNLRQLDGGNIAFETFDGVEAFPRFVTVGSDKAPAAISRFNRDGLFSVGRAELSENVPGAVYIVIGTGNRGAAKCFVVALEARNSHQAALDWLSAPNSGFREMKPFEPEGTYRVSTFVHPLIGNLGTRIDFYYATRDLIDSMTSFSAFTVGEMARTAPSTEPNRANK
jgi:hypothetical protein